jgi:hypothetical protein
MPSSDARVQESSLVACLLVPRGCALDFQCPASLLRYIAKQVVVQSNALASFDRSKRATIDFSLAHGVHVKAQKQLSWNLIECQYPPTGKPNKLKDLLLWLCFSPSTQQ